jgi:hypothetical protein
LSITTGLVVDVSLLDPGQIDLGLDQVVQRMLEAAGDQLRSKIDWQQAWAAIHQFVTGHVRPS